MRLADLSATGTSPFPRMSPPDRSGMARRGGGVRLEVRRAEGEIEVNLLAKRQRRAVVAIKRNTLRRIARYSREGIDFGVIGLGISSRIVLRS